MIYLIGASGHAKVILEIAELQNIKIGGLIDANPQISELLGYTVHQELTRFQLPEQYSLVISIGNNSVRKRISEQYSDNSKFETLIHPRANVSKRLASPIGEGTVIMPGATINSGASVGRHCIVNTNASVDHDCVLEDFVHVSPGVSLAGNVFVGEGTHVGIGASVIQGIKIGRNCTIGAGAVIIRDVPDGAKVVGNPGRVIGVSG